MKKVVRYCDKCRKQTTEFFKIMIYANKSRVKYAKTFDYCNICAEKLIKSIEE